LALEERGFCAALQKNGKIVRKESRKVEDFAPLINAASIAWIDYVVDDFMKDAPKVATSLGFSEILIKSLMKDLRSVYVDFDTELGMVLPAIIVEGFNVKLNPLLVLIKKNIIVTVHTTEVKRFFRLRRYTETLLRKLGKRMIKKIKLL
jgi:magnesium transporter